MFRLPLLSALALAVASPALAVSFPLSAGNAPVFGDFTPGAGGDVFDIDTSSFGVSAPLVFQSGIFGNPAQSGVGADDPAAIVPDANVIVIRNFDNDDTDGFPANWNASWNARTALEAIAANTTGDRPGFFLYWNEGLGVNRLFATDNLNDGGGGLSLLFTDTSANLSGVPGDVDLNLADGNDPTRTDLFPEANANFFELEAYAAANFAVADAVAPIPLPAGLPLMAAGLAGLAGLARCRRRAA